MDRSLEIEVLTDIATWLDDGEKVALATVVSRWGSSPRPPGSRMAVTQTGRIIGSVSGGCVEAAVVFAAQDVIRTGVSQLLKFGVTDERAWEVGLPCGGTIEVFVEPVAEIQ